MTFHQQENPSGGTSATATVEDLLHFSPVSGSATSQPPDDLVEPPTTSKDLCTTLPTTKEAGSLHSGTHPSSHVPSNSTTFEDDDSPYAFLLKDPSFLQQVTVKEEDAESALSTAEALKRLLEAGKSVPDLPPPQLRFSEGPAENENIAPVPTKKDTETTDYLKAGLNPDQVLQEMYRVKDSSGGIIDPTSMEPFLDYFGELSSRELERLESQQQQQSKSAAVAPTPPVKGVHRKKRMMAIRFPGQTGDTDPRLKKMLESVQLPEVPSSSDDSDDDNPEECLRPVTRAELLERMHKKYFPSDKEEDKEGLKGEEEASEKGKFSFTRSSTAASSEVGLDLSDDSYFSQV